MNLLIIIPRQPRTTGNHVSASRFAISLRHRGWQVRVVESGVDEVESIQDALRQPTDVALLLHGYRSGHPWLLSQPPGDLPYAVLMTGTDLNRDLDDPARAAIINQALAAAGAVIVQNNLAYDELLRSKSPWCPKLKLLPPGIVLGDETYLLRRQLGLNPDDLLLLHPASVRPVKGNLELLQMAVRVLDSRPQAYLAFCGPLLDDNYAARFLAALTEHPRASYLGEIPCTAMADVLRQSDLILNNSSSEGVPNALVEAVSLGRPILARNIPGNCSLVENEVNGLLFDNARDFECQLRRFLVDFHLRKGLSRPDPKQFSAALEGERLATILEALVV